MLRQSKVIEQKTDFFVNVSTMYDSFVPYNKFQ